MTKRQKRKMRQVCRIKVEQYTKILLTGTVILVTLLVHHNHLPVEMAIAIPTIVWINGHDFIGHLLEIYYKLEHKYRWF